MDSVTLTEFLLARIAEDEEIASQARDGDDLHPPGEPCSFCEKTWAARRHVEDPDRVLAECEAKRRIVEMAQGLIDQTDLSPLSAGFGRRLLLNLALPYADHPDFRDEWKP